METAALEGNMEQAEKLCDNLCMISQGQKVLDGTLTEVKSKFGKNSIQINIEGDGKFIKELPGVQGKGQVRTGPPLNCHLL